MASEETKIAHCYHWQEQALHSPDRPAHALCGHVADGMKPLGHPIEENAQAFCRKCVDLDAAEKLANLRNIIAGYAERSRHGQ